MEQGRAGGHRHPPVVAIVAAFVAAFGQAGAKSGLKRRAGFEHGHAARNHQRATYQRIVRGAAVAHHHMMLRGGHLVARHRVIQIGQVLLSEALAVHQGGIDSCKRHRRRSHGRIPVSLGTVPISGSTAQGVSKRMTPRQGNPGRGGQGAALSTRLYRTSGAMMSAKAVRARLRRDLTVPRFTPVISAISSYDFPSSSRSTNTSR